MSPNQLVSPLFIVCRIFLSSLTICKPLISHMIWLRCHLFTDYSCKMWRLEYLMLVKTSPLKNVCIILKHIIFLHIKRSYLTRMHRYAVIRVVNHPSVTTEGLVRCKGNPCGISHGQSGTMADLFLRTSL
jgi:hypothetical protein